MEATRGAALSSAPTGNPIVPDPRNEPLARRSQHGGQPGTSALQRLGDWLRWGPRWTVPGLSRGQVGALGPSAPTLPWFGRGQGHAHLRSSRTPGAERGFVG